MPGQQNRWHYCCDATAARVDHDGDDMGKNLAGLNRSGFGYLKTYSIGYYFAFSLMALSCLASCDFLRDAVFLWMMPLAAN